MVPVMVPVGMASLLMLMLPTFPFFDFVMTMVVGVGRRVGTMFMCVLVCMDDAT